MHQYTFQCPHSVSKVENTASNYVKVTNSLFFPVVCDTILMLITKQVVHTYGWSWLGHLGVVRSVVKPMWHLAFNGMAGERARWQVNGRGLWHANLNYTGRHPINI